MYSGSTLSLKTIENGFVELIFDNQNGSVNKFDQQTLAELAQAIAVLTSASSVRGLLVTSNKAVFVVGADITEFSDMFAVSEEEFLQAAQQVNTLFSQIEDLPFPSVASINGFALGGGLEICLACDSRVISDTAAVGLPETGLGILPGWGGTVRLPRLAGFATAAQWITTGAQQKADSALAVGVVDAVVAAADLRGHAIQRLQQMADGKLDYLSRRLKKKAPVAESAAELEAISGKIEAMIEAKFGDNYPAPLIVLELLRSAADKSRDAAVGLENHAFFKVTRTPQARALVGLFLSDQYIAKRARGFNKGLSEQPSKVSQAAVIGAGIMGGGIAYQNAIKGYPVVMKDINQSALDLGLSEATKLLAKSVARGKFGEEKAQQILSQIHPTLLDDDLSNCDMVVEAVVEMESVKKQVLSAVESLLEPSAVIASNTSTISINRLASSLQRPENFCGMHFFNPVHAMQLVEVIRGDKTSDHTVAALCNYALALGKKPIVVNDCPGFLVNRVLFAMLFGLEMMIKEGVDFQQIDQVMEDWGLPMGPAYLMDVIGLDTIHHCYSTMIDGLPERFVKTDSWPTETLFNAGRQGQKNGLGYYRYGLNDKGKPSKAVDPEAIAMIEAIASPAKLVSAEEVIDRLLIAMAMEMVHCLEEAVVASPEEADMALIYGVGFPAFRGGICRWMDEQGLDSIVERGDRYAHLSALYKPTDRLREMAARGATLYSN